MGGRSQPDPPHVGERRRSSPARTSGSTRVALIGGVDRDVAARHRAAPPRCPACRPSTRPTRAPAGRPRPPLNHGRAHHNTVQLPDRSMVTVGGGYGILNGNRRSGDAAVHRNIELYDAATGQWTPRARRRTSCAPTTRPRCCCRTAASCPPETTATAAAPTTPPRSTSRPTCSRARDRRSRRRPTRSTYGDTFTVETSSDATKAVLMAPAAVTHANDMSQRHVPLAATVRIGRAR